MINVLIVDDEPFIRQGLKILINWNENLDDYKFIEPEVEKTLCKK